MKLLVVEDEPRLRDSLQRGLRAAGFAVDCTGLGAEALRLAESHEFDLIVLDIMLPDIDGVDVCRELREKRIATPVLMLTALSATDEKVDGLRSGADDYLTKPYEFDELVARIHAILRRGQPTPARVLKFEDLELDLATRRGRRGDRALELTNKEFMLLELLMRHPEHVLSREQIGQKIWDMNFDPASNVIDVYIGNLRRQIDRGMAFPLIQTVKGAGYRLGRE